MRQPPSQLNQSIERSLACLFELVSASKPVGSREMAKLLRDEHTRVNRMLGTLRYLGLATQTPQRKYIPGPGLHVLSAMSMRGSQLLTCALPHLRSLIDQTGEQVVLGVLWQRHVCYLYFGGPRDLPEAALAARNPFPAELSSIGRCLLSLQPAKTVREIYASEPPQAFASTASLLKSLAQVRAAGYAVEQQGRSVAVAINATAAVAVSYPDPSSHLPGDLARLLRAAADGIRLDLDAAMSGVRKK